MLVDMHVYYRISLLIIYIKTHMRINCIWIIVCVGILLIDTAVLCVRKCRHITLVYVWLVVWIIFDFPYFVNNNVNNNPNWPNHIFQRGRSTTRCHRHCSSLWLRSAARRLTCFGASRRMTVRFRRSKPREGFPTFRTSDLIPFLLPTVKNHGKFLTHLTNIFWWISTSVALGASIFICDSEAT